MIINREALNLATPQPLVVGSGEDAESIRLRLLTLLDQLPSGADLAELKRWGASSYS